MNKNLTGESLTTCDNCDMARLESETLTAMGTDGSPLHTGCDSYKVECGDYGKARACENCEDIHLTEDMADGTDLWTGFKLCIGCQRTLCPPTRFDW